MTKVLLVEDDVALRDIYSARFMAEDFDVVTASDGEMALTQAVKERPDLIILDVMMPKISGFDVLDILRATPETKTTKVIMMTALSQNSDIDKGKSLGADEYLVKSQVTLTDVIEKAKEVLAR
jgi:DNA-binding response OmpR family regulator